MWSKITEYLRMIRFSHTLFALPFAYSGALLASKEVNITIPKIIWITLAMVGARSAAMGFNRFVDKEIDVKNNRTASRALPSGRINVLAVKVFIIIFLFLFFLSAFMLGPLTFLLSPVAAFIILSYSFSKRFTHYSHFFLGAALSLAPIGAWLGVTGYFHYIPFVLSSGVLMWTAGFDIIYSVQDYDFDRKNGLYSMVVKMGIAKSLRLSGFVHYLSLIFFFSIYFLYLQSIYFLSALIIIATIIIYQHMIVDEKDTSRLNTAFFTANIIISICFLIGTAAGLYL